MTKFPIEKRRVFASAAFSFISSLTHALLTKTCQQVGKCDFVSPFLIFVVLAVYASFTNVNFILIRFDKGWVKLLLQSQFLYEVEVIDA